MLSDSAAFNAAYERFHQRLYSYLRRLCRNPALADDLFQETWLKAARHGATLDAHANLEAWLFTIARNTFISHRRWQAFDLKRALAFFAARPAPLSESHDGLLGALQALPERDRELLLLIADSGLEPPAIAEVVGISYATFRQRLSRARGRLESIMKKEEAL